MASDSDLELYLQQLSHKTHQLKNEDYSYSSGKDDGCEYSTEGDKSPDPWIKESISKKTHESLLGSKDKYGTAKTTSKLNALEEKYLKKKRPKTFSSDEDTLSRDSINIHSNIKEIQSAIEIENKSKINKLNKDTKLSPPLLPISTESSVEDGHYHNDDVTPNDKSIEEEVSSDSDDILNINNLLGVDDILNINNLLGVDDILGQISDCNSPPKTESYNGTNVKEKSRFNDKINSNKEKTEVVHNRPKISSLQNNKNGLEKPHSRSLLLSNNDSPFLVSKSEKKSTKNEPKGLLLQKSDMGLFYKSKSEKSPSTSKSPLIKLKSSESEQDSCKSVDETVPSVSEISPEQSIKSSLYTAHSNLSEAIEESISRSTSDEIVDVLDDVEDKADAIIENKKSENFKSRKSSSITGIELKNPQLKTKEKLKKKPPPVKEKVEKYNIHHSTKPKKSKDKVKTKKSSKWKYRINDSSSDTDSSYSSSSSSESNSELDLYRLLHKILAKKKSRRKKNKYHPQASSQYYSQPWMNQRNFGYFPVDAWAQHNQPPIPMMPSYFNAGAGPMNSCAQHPVDDALKQSVELTRQFMETQLMLYNAYTSTLASDHRYTSLKQTEEFIKKNKKPPLTFKEAYKLGLQDKKN